MIPQSNSIDSVPLVNGVQSPERFPNVNKDSIDSCISIIDQHIKFSVLVFLNSFEECFNLCIIGMVNLNWDTWSTPSLDFCCNIFKQLLSSAWKKETNLQYSGDKGFDFQAQASIWMFLYHSK